MGASSIHAFMMGSLEFLSGLFVVVLSCLFLYVVCLYIADKRQYQHAIRHNFPVIGRFRYILEEWGTFFRQYFFSMDREEMPFNRAERSWVYRASKNVDRTIAFGSTRNLTHAGTVIFVNCPFPTLTEDAVAPVEVTIGPFCENPYKTRHFFNISAMSYGSISEPAVKALSYGAKIAGCWLNTGEGGLSPYHLVGGCDLVFQIGTAKYGVRDHHGNLSKEKLKEVAAHTEVKMFEVKLSQGAKPGKGGILPAKKVHAEIAKIRGIPEGEVSISPNGHTEITSIEELLDFIDTIRSVTQKPVGFKCVLGTVGWLDRLFEEIKRRGEESAPDFITLDSADGGTGAAPQALMDYMGLPIQESLPYLVTKLKDHNLRDRIKVICAGKMITPSRVAWALAVGADFVQSARGFMFALGCIQALKCNQDTCPTGVTTHNKKLQAGLEPTLKSVRVAQYQQNITYEVGMIAHSCGVKDPRQLGKRHIRVISDDGVSIALD
tara:strand:- start:8733 stop:10208 length:1476 start_codon:yes stop_codon:yes gene_type:complete